MKLPDLFRKAASVIRTNGWTREVLARDPKLGCTLDDLDLIEYAEAARACEVCLIGSIIYVSQDHTYSSTHNILLRQAIRQFEGVEKIHSVPWWNDAPGRTKEEVIQVLEVAALIAEKEEQ
jgi:hypothetical protein